ncbi:DUF6176 family protein [Paeniglutamicibacter antarcticus]|uniref:DUF6176 family protein n=1 Tax=Paeniglutamicibacter antarcticus TaxID=494023 RepID=A0ABP9TM82_9MICC
MRIELTRFRVREGARSNVDEWMQFLNANVDAVRETLEPEQMYVETIFSETIDGIDFLYWYSVQGEDGSGVEQSKHWLDEKHVQFWRACIDDSFPAEDLTPRVTMIPERVEASMKPLTTSAETR